jgi:hypothetical protein
MLVFVAILLVSAHASVPLRRHERALELIQEIIPLYEFTRDRLDDLLSRIQQDAPEVWGEEKDMVIDFIQGGRNIIIGGSSLVAGYKKLGPETLQTSSSIADIAATAEDLSKSLQQFADALRELFRDGFREYLHWYRWKKGDWLAQTMDVIDDLCKSWGNLKTDSSELSISDDNYLTIEPEEFGTNRYPKRSPMYLSWNKKKYDGPKDWFVAPTLRFVPSTRMSIENEMSKIGSREESSLRNTESSSQGQPGPEASLSDADASENDGIYFSQTI